MALLEVDGIHTYYGSIEALRGVSLEVGAGEVVTMIGSNGAGKSTTLRSISGLSPPRTRLDPLRRRVEIGAMPPSRIVGLGISQVPEGRRCFPADDRAREPRARRLPAARRRDRRRRRPRLRALSAPGGARGAEGGDDVRRRAADAGDRAGADGATEAAPARRALDGNRAAAGRADLQDDRRDQPDGYDDPAGRAERELRARGLAARLRARDRQGRALAATRRRCARTPMCRRRTWAHDRRSH